MPKITRVNPQSVLTLQAIRTLVDLMLETLATDKDAARYDDLCRRIGVVSVQQPLFTAREDAETERPPAEDAMVLLRRQLGVS